jgi:outer membrane receptor protein involved in Fe transport
VNIFERCLGAAAQSTLIYSTLLFVWTPPLQAQDSDSNKADDVIEEIVVIGSHIKRRDFTSPSPISTLDRETLAFSIQPTLEESLNKMPQVMPDFDRTANNPGDGTSRVNLRGLGSGRTLVLLNGRRVAPSGVSSSVDVNNIPQALVERVEVITGGATTVYGSDAVAGVVNFVTRDDFDGFGLDTSFYTTEHSDSNIVDLNLSYGHNFANGRGNITLNCSQSS